MELKSRRSFLATGAALAPALWTVPGAFAEQLAKTPAVEEGPFYPRKFPLDTDNDLLIMNNGITPAVGEITHLSGRLLDSRGEPVRNAVIEIWQVDHEGIYLQQQVAGQEKIDPNFQGYGRFLTGSTGDYYFRTIKPVLYKGRQAPHIHFQIRTKQHQPWTTQAFIKGFAGNEKDGIYRRLDTAAKNLVSLDFSPLKGSTAGELTAKFDIVLGWTPEG